MKNKIIAVLLACAFVLNFARPYKLRAYADAMTASMLGSVAYSIMQASGISFTAGNATGAGMDSFMTDQVESYVNSNGGSLTSLFGGEMARLAAGKLVVGQQMYNGVLDFVDWLKEKFEGQLSGGEYEGTKIGEKINAQTNWDGVGVGGYFGDYHEPNYPYQADGYHLFYAMNGNTFIQQYSSGGAFFYSGEYTVEFKNHNLYARVPYYYKANGNFGADTIASLVQNVEIQNTLDWSFPENWSEPAPLPQDKQWEGNFSGTPGWAEPQDLPDFLSQIPNAIANNNLVVQEEVTDTGGTPPSPTPNPSPSPSPAPYPGLSIAQKIALILGEITAIMFDTKGDTAEQTYQDIAEQVEQTTQDIAESLTDPITQTQTQTQQQIIDSTQDITQTITDTQTQTQEKLEDITQTIEDVTSVPDQTSWDKVKKDLHGVFPFCIPWDIYGMLNAFNAEPRAPYFEYPFKIPSINLDYNLELDFKDFDPVAQTLRTVELIAFCVGLAILTSKVIRW